MVSFIHSNNLNFPYYCQQNLFYPLNSIIPSLLYFRIKKNRIYSPSILAEVGYCWCSSPQTIQNDMSTALLPLLRLENKMLTSHSSKVYPLISCRVCHCIVVLYCQSKYVTMTIFMNNCFLK